MQNLTSGFNRFTGVVVLLFLLGTLNQTTHAAEPTDDCALNLDVDAIPNLPLERQITALMRKWIELSAESNKERKFAPDAIELAVYLQSSQYPAGSGLRYAFELLDSTQAMLSVEIKSHRYDQGPDLDRIEQLEIEIDFINQEIKHLQARPEILQPLLLPKIEKNKKLVARAEKEKSDLDTKLQQTENNLEAHELAKQLLDAQAKMIVFEAKGDQPKADFIRYHTISLLIRAGAKVRFYDPRMGDRLIHARDVLRYVKQQTKSLEDIGNPLRYYLEFMRREGLMTSEGPLDLEDSRYVAQRLLDKSIEYLDTRHKVTMIYGKDVGEALVALQDPTYTSALTLHSSIRENINSMLADYSLSKNKQLEFEVLALDVVRDAQGGFKTFVLSANNEKIDERAFKKQTFYRIPEHLIIGKSSEPEAQPELNYNYLK